VGWLPPGDARLSAALTQAAAFWSMHARSVAHQLLELLRPARLAHLAPKRGPLEAVLALAPLARRVGGDVHASGASPLPAQPLVGLDVGGHGADVGGGGEALAEGAKNKCGRWGGRTQRGARAGPQSAPIQWRLPPQGQCCGSTQAEATPIDAY
jgi:hypothetical protein